MVPASSMSSSTMTVSTLVETVSLNYEDFNESFLTCGTCLCVYDGSEHTPKLLPCSHTVCLHCLTRIAASHIRDNNTFRCPICRELITIPRGGVAALPPSFLVNQLLDLMSRQRREVVPKCSVHLNQELLFCESCDAVFCSLCTGGTHSSTPSPAHRGSYANPNTNLSNASTSCEHTVIPFSIAIKRMSEILLYKANECIAKLTSAQESVTLELQRLDSSTEKCLEAVNTTFSELAELVDFRKQQMLTAVSTAAMAKKKVLQEQHALIETEKSKVEQECEGLQYQVEVRSITQRISSLGEKLDSACILGDPRENAFLTCDFRHNDSVDTVTNSLQSIGRVRTSTTFPSLCTAVLDMAEVVKGLMCSVTLRTVDYHGENRVTGGDPVCAVFSPCDNEIQSQSQSQNNEGDPCEVFDNDDGTYKIRFRPTHSGQHSVRITVFDRPIRDYPLIFTTTEHNNPLRVWGHHGNGKDGMSQPVAVVVMANETSDDDYIYVVDSGNSRIVVFTRDLEFVKHLNNEGLEGRSCTGIACHNEDLVLVNWRTKNITIIDTEGETKLKFTHESLAEPTCLAVDPHYGHILVADNRKKLIFVFDEEGKLLFEVGTKESFNLISAIAIGPNSEIVVADSKILVFSSKGNLIRKICADDKAKGHYGGLTIDSEGRIIAAHTEKGRNVIQIFSLQDGTLLSTIDSNEHKLKRPSGLATTCDHHLIAVDLGHDCLKKYRYW